MSKISEKTEEMCNGFIKKPRILIYDDKNLIYIVGWQGFFDYKPSPPIEITCTGDLERSFMPGSDGIITCSVANYEQLNNIELDETTMKRIAKYNKEIDIKKLDEIIKEKEEKIKELDDILQDKSKRVNKIKEFIADIYEIDITDDDYDDYD